MSNSTERERRNAAPTQASPGQQAGATLSPPAFQLKANQPADSQGDAVQMKEEEGAGTTHEARTTTADASADAGANGLSGSVGRGGDNNESDVKKVQELLNSQGHNLEADGKIGGNTIGAIQAFQRRALGFSDGLVSAGGQTWDALNGDKLNDQSVNLIYASKVSTEFAQKTIRIANEIGVNPNYLMGAMAFESGGTFSPSIKNAAGSGATGLIQFMPNTATSLGTSTAALAEMTAEEQLDYVRLYFLPYRGKLSTLEDIYMAILWPAAVGKDNSHVLWSRGTTAYAQNSGLDSNGDGSVTKGEAAGKVRVRYDAGASDTAEFTGNGGAGQSGGIVETITETVTNALEAVGDFMSSLTTLQGTVGEGGQNNAADVAKVQHLLIQHGAGIQMTGEIDEVTIGAISNFQQQNFGWQDGLVEPGGKTWGALLQAVAPPAAIGGSVGEGGQNEAGDVETVQTLLKGKGHDITVDGKIGSETIGAITAFQESTFGWSDGLVEVGGKTWGALSGQGQTADGGQQTTGDQTTGDQTTDDDDQTAVDDQQTTTGDQTTGDQTTGDQTTADHTTTDAPVTTTARGITIEKSVGIRGENQNADVRKIQQALSDIGIYMGTVDGVAGQITKSAVWQFQRAMGLGNDGRVDPGGGTLRKINETPDNAMKTTQEMIQNDDEAPQLTHSAFTSRHRVTADGDGRLVPKQFWGKMQVLIDNLEIIGNELGITMNINSGYRSPEYNDQVDGVVQSNHQIGEAADLAPSGMSTYDFWQKLKELRAEGKIRMGGLGYYPRHGFVHYDVRGSQADWTIR